MQLQKFYLASLFLLLFAACKKDGGGNNTQKKLLISDPMSLSNRSYATALKYRIEKMTARNEVDIYNLKSASDNTVDGGDIRSGLQLS